MKVHSIKACRWGDVGHFDIGKWYSSTARTFKVDAQARDGEVINGDKASKRRVDGGCGKMEDSRGGRVVRDGSKGEETNETSEC